MTYAAMPRESAFYTRIPSLYRAMKQRFGVKYWKSGRLAGHIRQVGQEMPFTSRQFCEWFEEQLGGIDAAVQCFYCPKFVTALDARVDHRVPIKQGGHLGFTNLCLCCDECNREKGGMTDDGFRAFRAWLISPNCPLTVQDALDIQKRMRGGIVYQKTKKSFQAMRKASVTVAPDEEPF